MLRTLLALTHSHALPPVHVKQHSGLFGEIDARASSAEVCAASSPCGPVGIQRLIERNISEDVMGMSDV